MKNEDRLKAIFNISKVCLSVSLALFVFVPTLNITGANAALFFIIFSIIQFVAVGLIELDIYLFTDKSIRTKMVHRFSAVGATSFTLGFFWLAFSINHLYIAAIACSLAFVIYTKKHMSKQK